MRSFRKLGEPLFSLGLTDRTLGAGFTNQDNTPSISLPTQMINSSRVILDFETASGYSKSDPNATVADNTTQHLYGTQSVKFSTASGVAFYSVKTINQSFANDQSFRFCIYLHDGNLSNVMVQISSVTNLSKRMQYTFNQSALNAIRPGWNIINVDKTDFSVVSGESWDNTMIRMMFQFTPLSGVVEVSLDNFFVVSAKPGVMIMFDDGGATVFTQGYNYMRQKQVVGTSYTISSLIDDVPHTYMTSAQIQELNQQGWDVGNHSSDGNTLIGLSQGDVQTKLAACKTFLDNLGLTRASSHVAYPGGGVDATVIAAMAAESMLTGRGTNNRYVPTLPIGDAYQLQNNTIVNTTTLAQAKALVDAAVAQKEIVPLLFHSLVTTPTLSTHWAIADFQALIDYIRQVNIQTLTISEYYRLNTAGITVNHY